MIIQIILDFLGDIKIYSKVYSYGNETLEIIIFDILFVGSMLLYIFFWVLVFTIFDFFKKHL